MAGSIRLLNATTEHDLALQQQMDDAEAMQDIPSFGIEVQWSGKPG